MRTRVRPACPHPKFDFVLVPFCNTIGPDPTLCHVSYESAIAPLADAMQEIKAVAALGSI
jgi:hypothetical protein